MLILTSPGPPRLGRLYHRVAQLTGADESLGLAVADDVRGLGPGQVPVDRRETQADALGGVEDLEELRLVGAHERQAVAGLEPARPERPRHAVDVCVEVGVRAIPVR